MYGNSANSLRSQKVSGTTTRVRFNKTRFISVFSGVLLFASFALLFVFIPYVESGSEDSDVSSKSYNQPAPGTAEEIELEPINDFADIEEIKIVPSVKVDENDGSVGEVLSAGICSGRKVGSDKFICGETTASWGSDGDEVTVPEDCPVRILQATYPAFFEARDLDGNPKEISLERCEWPGLSNLFYQKQSSVVTQNGELYAGSEFLNSGDVMRSPVEVGDDNTYDSDLKEADEISVQIGSSEGTVVTDPCDESPLDSVECGTSAKVQEEVESGIFEQLLYPQANRSISRPDAGGMTCPMYEEVGGKNACTNSYSLVTRLGDLLSRFGGGERQKVKVVIMVDSLLGSNEGCGEGCIDYLTDMWSSYMNGPVKMGAQCTSNPGDLASPCAPDYYVGTVGKCSVCGKTVDCTFVWSNYLPYYYNTASKGLDPTACEGEYCSLDGYLQCVYRLAGGSR